MGPLSVRGFAAAFLSEFPKLDILVNNAGSGDRAKMRTKQGDEMIYGVNYFSHFLLTELLLPTLMSSPDGRIVNLASMTHRYSSKDISVTANNAIQ
ncbi:hypothetical protein T484DRAFT_1855472, partial [Baffinella frigidus]